MHLQKLPMFGKSPVFPLGGITFSFDPVLRGFLEDSGTIALIILVIGFKIDNTAGESLAAELEARLKAYLAFYPYWLEMTRQDDREAQKRRRTNARLRLDRKADVERIPDPSTVSQRDRSDWITGLERILETGDAANIIHELGIRDPRGIAALRWGPEGLLERQIAERVGISQQAVSAQVRRIYQELMSEFQKRSGLEPGHNRPKGKWSPRG
jgi:hypothetical protein